MGSFNLYIAGLESIFFILYCFIYAFIFSSLVVFSSKRPNLAISLIFLLGIGVTLLYNQFNITYLFFRYEGIVFYILPMFFFIVGLSKVHNRHKIEMPKNIQRLYYIFLVFFLMVCVLLYSVFLRVNQPLFLGFLILYLISFIFWVYVYWRYFMARSPLSLYFLPGMLFNMMHILGFVSLIFTLLGFREMDILGKEQDLGSPFMKTGYFLLPVSLYVMVLFLHFKRQS